MTTLAQLIRDLPPGTSVAFRPSEAVKALRITATHEPPIGPTREHSHYVSAKALDAAVDPDAELTSAVEAAVRRVR